VATGSQTPPDRNRPSGMTREQTDQLAVRLQDALGEGYKVERPLGSGGFAVVYLVRDLTLKRQVAVKVLSPDLIQSHTVLERFRREAETVAQLSHPHIVPLYFVGQKDDLVYLAMECVTGGTLADRLEREGRLPVDEVARIVREVAEALAHAHKRGVVHRDIKPQNVLLDPETGRCLVTDFGIARTAEGASLTASGMLVGTAAYLSPEQITGAHADHRSDLYALGVMAYEMLTGEPPFTGPTPTAVLMKRLAAPPVSLEKLRPEVPRVLREVVEACLAQDPAERFQSGGEIARALGGQTPVSGGHATAEVTLGNRRRKRRRSRLARVAVAVAVVAAAAGGYALLRPRPAAPAGAAVDAGMAVVPGGVYTIGSDSGPMLARPAHQVTLAAFSLDRHEVTVGDYDAYVRAGRAPAPWTAKPADDLPVTGVLWAEAVNYCAWKHPPDGRLPSEEEWEAAARGKAGRAYPWGDRWNPAAANTASARRSGPAPVGSFPLGASPEGVLDLIGNVWEWTNSPMGLYAGAASQGPATPGQYYVIRGGAFNTSDEDAVATRRGYLPPAAIRSMLQNTGFRCAMPLRGAAR
jgi:formylglycine-generating enzyme required for sulfatase activity/tRNA A-37 threonylcarbamoyl transferase component Bud32